MNDRIRELAIEAGYLPDNFGVGHWDMPECKKFVELIVKECVDVCLDRHHTWRWDNEPDSLSGPRDCAQSIKEHFGVEQ